ncbi:MAG: Hsp70 family protein, partial [Pseudonocardia sp.]|nr:Hsp70 family protein [Pseudonocardia sp.]
MGYGLGVDLGTTFTAAAVERDGRVEMVTLGDRTAAVPSVVLLRADGSVLSGDAADRRAVSEPDRVAREVKRRLGDPMPVILGGAPVPVQELMAMQLRDVVRAVAEREGGEPDTVTLTHPANWGPYKRELFGQIPALAGLDRVRMLTEPEAAAAHYASTERVPDGALVAVYDLGGGTFDATVLRVGTGDFEIFGTPEGIEGLGGIDFDEAVFAHVDRVLDGAASALDPSDLRATSAAIRLRQECVLAKEALSADTETTIPVLLPAVQTEVRLTRGEFEDMIRPSVVATVDSMRRALRSAGVTPAELQTVLLVGGSSRIPAVARTVAAELGRPTSVDAHPKHAIALGAAAVSARSAPSTAAAPEEEPVGVPGAAGARDAGSCRTGDVPGDDTPTPPHGVRAVPPVPAAATVAAAVPAGPEATLPATVASGTGASAAGTPAPSLSPPA